LEKQICAVCCATKRLIQIRCPSDCPYLVTARDHPPAAVVRQHQRDVGYVVQFMRDFNERQSELFVMLATFLVDYKPPELQTLSDADVGDAADALASTFETAARGLIYEHSPASLAAQRLAAAMHPLIVKAGRGGGTPFDRDAAVVLRRLSAATREMRELAPAERRGFLELLGRVIRVPREGDRPVAEPPRLIVP
jgi:hypothetical protein